MVSKSVDASFFPPLFIKKKKNKEHILTSSGRNPIISALNTPLKEDKEQIMMAKGDSGFAKTANADRKSVV